MSDISPAVFILVALYEIGIILTPIGAVVLLVVWFNLWSRR